MLHRLMLKEYHQAIQFIAPRRDKHETDLIKQALSASKSDLTERQTVARQGFEKARDLEKEWRAALKSQFADKTPGFLYSQAWRKWNKAAGLADL